MTTRIVRTLLVGEGWTLEWTEEGGEMLSGAVQHGPVGRGTVTLHMWDENGQEWCLPMGDGPIPSGASLAGTKIKDPVKTP